MAINTKDARSSAIEIMLPWRRQLPIPNGTINAGDRAELALLYSRPIVVSETVTLIVIC